MPRPKLEVENFIDEYWRAPEIRSINFYLFGCYPCQLWVLMFTHCNGLNYNLPKNFKIDANHIKEIRALTRQNSGGVEGMRGEACLPTRQALF